MTYEDIHAGQIKDRRELVAEESSYARTREISSMPLTLAAADALGLLLQDLAGIARQAPGFNGWLIDEAERWASALRRSA